MMMFETSKHVPKTEKRCCVFENNRFICANKTVLIIICILIFFISWAVPRMGHHVPFAPSFLTLSLYFTLHIYFISFRLFYLVVCNMCNGQ